MAVASVSLTPQVRSFLSKPGRFATIATIDADGMPHQVIVWYLLRGDDIVINSKVGRRWPNNLLRDPRIGFGVEEAGDGVTINGTVEVIATGEEAQFAIAEMARLYDGGEMAEREIATFQTQQRITFLIRPTKVHVHGDPR